MKCVICKNGTTQPGKVNVYMQKNNTNLIVKQVSARVCNNCGEYYLDSNTVKKLETIVSEANNRGEELAMLKMPA